MSETLPELLGRVQQEHAIWAAYNFGSEQTITVNASAHSLLGVIEELGELTEAVMVLRQAGSVHGASGLEPLVAAVGQLAHAHLKRAQGIRGSMAELRTQQRDAIGDILIYLLDYANREGVAIDELLCEIWADVQSRDWKRFPRNGRTE